ncbi:hypothetical protein PF010_g25048 [Phytophthora fragariae]|uniref:Uncharacterized protein n=1 Tax=Phytophthora fragariae TaxID=53985 RepID=A0A6A3WS24_9STRA|nr:hypothetical protein PF010_g25048 [Phytophthora fragariae]KAE9183614.1 hypothetical protein PF004_g23900 [Phytophthora fragariae]KAE9186689.1 hypothetical protein PF002_g25807 [Phytophthora fragariae]
MSCFTHVKSNCRKNRSRLSNSAYLEASILVNVGQMHLGRSPEQFFALVEEGQRDRERRVKCPQNPVEAHHSVIKTYVKLRAMTAVVLNTTIPRVLKKTASNSASTPFSGHFCEGPLLVAMCERAVVLTQPGNFFKKHSERHGQGALTAIYFNSFRYTLTRSRTLRSYGVTSSRVTRYSKSKEGELTGFRRIEDIDPHYLSP